MAVHAVCSPVGGVTGTVAESVRGELEKEAIQYKLYLAYYEYEGTTHFSRQHPARDSQRWAVGSASLVGLTADW